MNKKNICIRIITIIILCIFIQGCGYFMSGTWEDDPENWGRAFNSTKPDDVVVVHSVYTRYAHWSYEFEYYFEIRNNDELKTQLFTMNELIELSLNENNFVTHSKKPDWFLPKDLDKYKMYVYKDDVFSNFRVYEDIESGNIFLYDRQI